MLLTVQCEKCCNRSVSELSAERCAPALDTLPAVNVGRFRRAA